MYLNLSIPDQLSGRGIIAMSTTNTLTASVSSFNLMWSGAIVVLVVSLHEVSFSAVNNLLRRYITPKKRKGTSFQQMVNVLFEHNMIKTNSAVAYPSRDDVPKQFGRYHLSKHARGIIHELSTVWLPAHLADLDTMQKCTLMDQLAEAGSDLTCTVCLCEVLDDNSTTCKNGHVYCCNCLRGMFKSRPRKQYATPVNEMTCCYGPRNALCGSAMDLNARVLVSGVEARRQEYVSLSDTLQSKHSKIRGYTCNCGEIVSFHADEVKTRDDHQCFKCGHTICTKCLDAWHPGRPCVEPEAREGVRLMHNDPAVNRPCYHCGHCMQKNGGCFHMNCIDPECIDRNPTEIFNKKGTPSNWCCTFAGVKADTPGHLHCGYSFNSDDCVRKDLYWRHNLETVKYTTYDKYLALVKHGIDFSRTDADYMREVAFTREEMIIERSKREQ